MRALAMLLLAGIGTAPWIAADAATVTYFHEFRGFGIDGNPNRSDATGQTTEVLLSGLPVPAGSISSTVVRVRGDMGLQGGSAAHLDVYLRNNSAASWTSLGRFRSNQNVWTTVEVQKSYSNLSGGLLTGGTMHLRTTPGVGGNWEGFDGFGWLRLTMSYTVADVDLPTSVTQPGFLAGQSIFDLGTLTAPGRHALSLDLTNDTAVNGGQAVLPGPSMTVLNAPAQITDGTLTFTGLSATPLEITGMRIEGADAGLFEIANFSPMTLLGQEQGSLAFDLDYLGGSILGETLDARIVLETNKADLLLDDASFDLFGDIVLPVTSAEVPMPGMALSFAVATLALTARRRA